MLMKIVSEKQMSTGFEDAAIFANPTDRPWVSEDQKADNFPQVSSPDYFLAECFHWVLSS